LAPARARRVSIYTSDARGHDANARQDVGKEEEEEQEEELGRRVPP